MEITLNLASYFINCVFQIGDHLVLGVEEEGVERMVLVDANQKESGVVWKMEVLRVQVEAEAEVDLVEKQVEAEVNLSKPIYIA